MPETLRQTEIPVGPASIESDERREREQRIADLQSKLQGVKRKRQELMDRWARLGPDEDAIKRELRSLGVDVRG